MDWLSLAALGIIWAILLVPDPQRREPPSPLRRQMSIEQEDFRHPGRWILAPRRGSRFVGRRTRARLRARERRRNVVLVLLEAIGLTGLIGLFPPLRGMLLVTAILGGLLFVYMVLVLRFTRGRHVAGSPDVTGRIVVLPEARSGEGAVEEQDRRLARIASS